MDKRDLSVVRQGDCRVKQRFWKFLESRAPFPKREMPENIYVLRRFLRPQGEFPTRDGQTDLGKASSGEDANWLHVFPRRQDILSLITDFIFLGLRFQCQDT